MKYLAPIDMVLNSILRLVLEKLSSDPTGTEGRVYYNTTSKEIRYHNGTAWATIGANMTASQILTQLLTVDGAGSGLDADLLDGLNASAFALAAHTHTASQITDFNTVVDSRIMAAFTNQAVDATVDTIAEFTQLIKDNQANIAAVLSVKRYQTNIGNGSLTTFTITHNLNTLDVHVQVVEISTGETIWIDVARNGVNSCILTFGAGNVPTNNQYRVIVIA
jgi:hypothetical protein